MPFLLFIYLFRILFTYFLKVIFLTTVTVFALFGFIIVASCWHYVPLIQAFSLVFKINGDFKLCFMIIWLSDRTICLNCRKKKESFAYVNFF
jgi:hypothetical protein